MIRRIVQFSVFAGVLAATGHAAGQPRTKPFGHPLTLEWDASPEPDVVGYLVHVGTVPGEFSHTFDVGRATSFRFARGVAHRRYYFAVTAHRGGQLSALSNMITAVIDPALPGDIPEEPDDGGTPNPPGHGGDHGQQAVVLHSPIVSGNVVTLGWRVTGGLDPAAFILEAGTASGLSDLFNGPLGPLHGIDVAIAPGTYFIRIRATTQLETIVSNEVAFSIPSPGGECAGPPPAPPHMTATISDGVAKLDWDESPGATSYILQLGSASGRSDIWHGDIGGGTDIAGPLPAGFAAFTRVVAVNACGQSAPSAELFLSG